MGIAMTEISPLALSGHGIALHGNRISVIW